MHSILWNALHSPEMTLNTYIVATNLFQVNAVLFNFPLIKESCEKKKMCHAFYKNITITTNSALPLHE